MKKRGVMEQLANVVYDPGSEVGQKGFDGSYEIRDRMIIRRRIRWILSWNNREEYAHS